MKILLVYPYCLEERGKDYDVRPVPIGLYYIGAVLKENGHEVEIVNWYNIHKNPQEIEHVLKNYRPDIIGFSIFNANRWGGIEIAHLAKKIIPQVKIVFGGVDATFLWKHLLTYFQAIDYIVLGEGEYPFLALVEALEKGDAHKIENLSGIACRKDGKIVRTKPGEYIPDLDTLPNPARYFSFQHVVSSRGCPYDCTFCGSPKFWKRKVRFHSPEYFVDQLELLYKKGISFFYVSDDTFTFKKSRVIDICKDIIGRGLDITWVAISRVNCVDEDILYWMRKAGCIQISYGVESGSEKMRAFFNKKTRTEDIRRAFALTRKFGILPRAYFIYGSPGETWETVQESIDLMHEIKPLAMVSYILDIYPGTALYSHFKEKSKIDDDIWLNRIEDIMYHQLDPKLSSEKVLSFGRKIKSEFYKGLSEYVDSLELVDKKDLYRHHSDFLSRLGMTFSHGDYSQIEEIGDSKKIAEKLFKRALLYSPDHTAYLGLGVIYQKRRDFEASIRILEEGLRHFPKSEELNVCLGINYMNTGDFKKAVELFAMFPESENARRFYRICMERLG